MKSFASKLSPSSLFNTSVFWCVCMFVCVFWFEFCHIVCKSTFLLKFLSSSYAHQTRVNFYYCIQINISLKNFHSFSYLHQTQQKFCYILFIQINIYLAEFVLFQLCRSISTNFLAWIFILRSKLTLIVKSMLCFCCWSPSFWSPFCWSFWSSYHQLQMSIIHLQH
jgi:hypothetical protein